MFPRRDFLRAAGALGRVVLTVAIASAAACAPPEPSVPAGGESDRLAVRLFMRTPAGTARAVELAQPVFSGDQLALEIRVAPGRQLVVLKEPGLERLAAASSGATSGAGSEMVRVPGTGWLQLSGPEAAGRVVMIVARNPVSDAQARELIEAARGRRDLDERIIAIDPAYAAHRRPGGTEIAGPRRTFRLRGPWLAEDGSAGAIRSEGYPEDEALIVELRIQTER